VQFELDSAQHAWREMVRSFLRENVTPELLHERRESGYHRSSEALATFRRRVGERGWFGLNWPKEYGGLALGPIYQHLLVNEFEYWGAPSIGLTVTSVAPMIMRYGTEHNKAEFLPPIARGELTCAVGYSEPNAGTDLASLKTRAELDGDEWVINGQKIWNSQAHMATHEWLCVRTDPAAPRHRGMSVIMVPIDRPGIDVRPLMTWDDFRTNQTFFTDVRVPRTNLIGEVNRGWQYITGALDLERGAVTNAGDLRRAVDELIDAARLPVADGSRPMDSADIRRGLAQLEADVDAAVLMGLEAASLLDSKLIPTIAVTAEKVFSSELRQRIADLGTRMFGLEGVLSAGDPYAAAGGSFEKLYRTAPLLRFGGGANEVLRDVIAQRGHGMPGYGR
jgi:3-oxocholest-4-en-26-oyl-CoA dehydrogenase alpha subunit